MTWKLDDGRVIQLFTPRDLAHTPDGTVLTCIDGSVVVKGTDHIDGDTRGGYLAFGTVAEDRNYSETPNSSPDDLLGTVKKALDVYERADSIFQPSTLDYLTSEHRIWLRAIVTRCEQAEAEAARLRAYVLKASVAATEREEARVRQHHDEVVEQRDEARYKLDKLRVECAAEDDANLVGQLTDSLSAHRQRHAEALEQAFREGYMLAFIDHGGEWFAELVDAAWLASEAKKGLG